jgi:hypothetical protein
MPKKYISSIVIVLLFYTNISFAQSSFYTPYYDNNIAKNILETDAYYILSHARLNSYGFGLLYIDKSNGSIIHDQQYGTSNYETLKSAHLAANQSVILSGSSWNFNILDSTNNNKDRFLFVPYVVHIDSNRNVISQYPIIQDTAYAMTGHVYHTEQIGNYYYHVGERLDQLNEFANSATDCFFVCKTDINGHIIWHKKIFENAHLLILWQIGLSASFDGSKLIIGTGVQTYGPENKGKYQMYEIDTNGNNLKRFNLPDHDSIIVGNNSLTDIKPLPNYRYLAKGTRDLFILDSSYNILQQWIPPTLQARLGYFAHKIPNKNEYLFQGNKIVSVFDSIGNIIHAVDFETDSKLTFIKDAIPTSDGGILVLMQRSDILLAVKTFCDGWYLPSQACWATAINDVKKPEISISPNPSTGIYNISIPVKNWQVHNLLGQIVAQGKGTYVDVTQHTAGIYLLKIVMQNNTSAILKLLKE